MRAAVVAAVLGTVLLMLLYAEFTAWRQRRRYERRRSARGGYVEPRISRRWRA